MALSYDMDNLPGSRSPSPSAPPPPPPPPPPPTTWEIVSKTYSAVAATFPAGPPSSNEDIKFLAALPGTEGFLVFNEKGSKEFKLAGLSKARQAMNIKAALAQAAGIVAPISCTKCAEGFGLWKVCASAPTRPSASSDIFLGKCPSHFYNGQQHSCNCPISKEERRARRIQELLAMDKEQFKEEAALYKEAAALREEGESDGDVLADEEEEEEEDDDDDDDGASLADFVEDDGEFQEVRAQVAAAFEAAPEPPVVLRSFRELGGEDEDDNDDDDDDDDEDKDEDKMDVDVAGLAAVLDSEDTWGVMDKA